MDLAKPKSGARIFFSRTRRTWVVQLRAQYTEHWTSKQSCGVGVPAVQLTMHVKSSTLYRRTGVRVYGHTVIRSYGHTVIWSYGHTVIRSYGRIVIQLYSCTVAHPIFRLDGLLLFCIIMGLHPVSSAII